ncbi:MAG: response regulator transcription factor [Epsilonproteobacteria bacterium]|nr:response regulator transcription factor [Campylobacterota bacterium]
MLSEDKEYDILYVEDEDAIRENYVKFLEKYFKNIYQVADGEKAYEVYKEKRPKIMLVDINLPKLNGIDLVKKIREHDYTTKIIMLTANTDIETLLRATELKLTKYLVKPVSRGELKEALLLVIKELSSFEIKSKKIIILKDGYSWDVENIELRSDTKILMLTNKEREILKLLFSNINLVYTYNDIIENIWGYDSYKIDALKTIIKNLRKKLPKDSIKNIFGVGYKINLS